jgi:hypothetical protein
MGFIRLLGCIGDCSGDGRIGDCLGDEQERIKELMIVIHQSVLNNVNDSAAKEGDDIANIGDPGQAIVIGQPVAFKEVPGGNPFKYPPKFNDSAPISI